MREGRRAIFLLYLLVLNECHHCSLCALDPTNPDAAAVPSSLNDLSPSPSAKAPRDSRTLDKLFDGTNDTHDDRHMWLSPLLPSAHNPNQPRNVLYVYFDTPRAIAAMKIWNYSKTPARGVQGLQVLLDDVIIWDGVLRQAPPPASGSSKARPSFAQSLLFCAHPALVERESANVYRDPSAQDVLLVDERRFVNQPSALAAPVIPPGRTHAQVAASGKQSAQRPTTSAPQR